jgi:hypothetical protein
MDARTDTRTDTRETQTAASLRKPDQSQTKPVDSKQASSTNAVDEVQPRVAKIDMTRRSTTTNSSADTPRHAGALAELLVKSRSELDGLLAETQTIHERSWRVIQSLLEDLQLRAWRAVDSAVGGVGEEIHDRVNYEISTILEHLDVEAEARLAARLDQAVSKAREQQRSLEKELAVLVGEHEKQISQMSTRASEGLQQREGRLEADLQKNVDRMLNELTKAGDEIINDIRQLGESVSGELEQRRAQTVHGFQSQLEQLWNELARRADERISESIKTCTSTMAKQAREIVDHEMSTFFIQALRHRLDQSPNSTLDEITEEQRDVVDAPPDKRKRSQHSM